MMLTEKTMPESTVDRNEGRSLPEFRLYREILIQAIKDLHNGGKVAERARLWINGADARITFADCCECVGLNPRYFVERVDAYLNSLAEGTPILRRRQD